MKAQSLIYIRVIGVVLLVLLLSLGGIPTTAQGPVSPSPSPTAQRNNQPIATPTPGNDIGLGRLSTSDSATVNVSASAQWVNTGIIVHAGDRLAITAEGSWNPGAPLTAPVGPDGSSQSWPDNFLDITDIGTCAYCAQTRTPYWAALIGYIGSSPPAVGSYTSASVLPEARKIFLVGSNLSTIVSSSGILWLNFNDDAYSSYTVDNYGQVTASISIEATRQDLINAYADLRDAVKSAISSDANKLIDMDTAYIVAMTPDWGKKIFQMAVGIIPSGMGADTAKLVELMKPFEQLNTSTDIGTTMTNIMDGLPTNPTDVQVRAAVTNGVNNSLILNPYISGTSSHIGFNQLLSDVDTIFANETLRLPDPLPVNYPTASTIQTLQRLTAQINASKYSEVDVGDYSMVQAQCTIFKVGSFADHIREMDILLQIYNQVDQISFRLSVAKLGTLGVGALGKAAFTYFGSLPGFIAAEDIVWAPYAVVGTFADTFNAVSDALQVSGKGYLSYEAFRANHQSVMDSVMRYQAFVDAGDWMNSLQGSQVRQAISSLSGSPDIAIVSLNTPDITLAADQMSGIGQGTVIVQNNGSIALTLAAFGDIDAILNGEQFSIVGLVASDAPATVAPGAQATLTFHYTVVRSSFTDPSGYQLSLTVRGIDPGGNLQFLGPNLSSFLVGTAPQLAALSSQQFKVPLTGELAAGSQSFTSFTTAGTTQKVRFSLMMNGGSDFDLHLYDSQGRHTGFSYSSGLVETNIPGSSYSGSTSSSEWISVNQSGGKTYKVVAVAINTAGGSNYAVSSLETPWLPALLDSPTQISFGATSKNTSVMFNLPLIEYGGFDSISNVSISISSLTDSQGHNIAANRINLQAPSSIGTGTTALASGVINLVPMPSAGVYKGAIQINGTDAQSGTPLSAMTQIQLEISWQQIFLPVILRSN